MDILYCVIGQRQMIAVDNYMDSFEEPGRHSHAIVFHVQIDSLVAIVYCPWHISIVCKDKNIHFYPND